MTCNGLAEFTDIQSVRSAMEHAPIGDVERYRIEGILARPGLTARDCFDIRTALLTYTATRDRLHGLLNSFPGTTVIREFVR